MNICILGAGSLGSVMGGMLASGGNDVTLINHNQAFCDAVNTNGLQLVTGEDVQTVKVKAARTPEGLAPVDLIVVLVKSKDTEAAMRAATALIGPNTTVVSLQNGLGQEAILQEIAGADKVIGGKTYVGGVMTVPGKVIASAKGKETIIGELDGTVSERAKRIAEVFTAVRLETRVSDNIVGAMWDKLLANVASAGPCAITGLNFGNLYQVPEIEQLSIAALEEVLAIARAKGIQLSSSDAKALWEKTATGLPFGFKASMLQSLEKGSITEADFVYGAVMREGQAAGVPTPVNTTLLALIKGVERALDPAPDQASIQGKAKGASIACLDHVAIHVRDIHWHIRFFAKVFAMPVTMMHGDPEDPVQLWTLGGMQLISSPDFNAAKAQLNHLGFAVGDPDAAIAAARKFGVKSDPRGENWLVLPDGLVVEVLPTNRPRVNKIRSMDLRA